MKRFAALVATVVMVSVSLFIRSRIDDDGGGSGSSNTSGGRPVVACVTELADACRAAYGDFADVRVEEARETAIALARGGGGLDAWVTLSGWPELVSETGTSPALVSTAMASTPMVIAAVKERAAVLTCATDGWSCFLNSAGKPWADLGGSASWGTVKVGRPGATSATGLLLEASAITGLAGTVDVGTNDEKFTEARSLLTRVDQSSHAFDEFAVQLPARFSAVGALQVDVDKRSGARADQITTIPLNPATNAIAVVARVGSSKRIDPSKLAKPLTTAGWTAPPARSSGLPDAGLLLALAAI